jgi:hypothetical protein
MQFVEFDAIVKRHSRVAHAGDRQPTVCHRRARAAACTEDDHIDESRVIGARIEARSRAARGWQATPRSVGHTDSRAKRPESALHGVDQPIAEICGGDRAGRRMARDSDDATLPQADVDPAIAARIGRHARPDTVEDPQSAPDVAVPSVRLSPQGMLSGLSRRSTVMRAASGSTLTIALMRTPSAGVPGNGSCMFSATAVPAGSLRIAAIMRASL